MFFESFSSKKADVALPLNVGSLSYSNIFLTCPFNGKEKDYESGFHYYGARYYWSEVLTSWLSVDPMMDKYPSLSPYNYCMWNPVKLVDPDGNFPFLTHASIVWEASAGLGFSFIDRVKLCYGTSVQADLIDYSKADVHLDGYSQKSPENTLRLTDTYNQAIQDCKDHIGNGGFLEAGESLHTIAYFYSHSNYIELYEEYATDNNISLDNITSIPTFTEAQKDKNLMSFLKGRLVTGKYPNDPDDIKNSHKGMNKDTNNGMGGDAFGKSNYTKHQAALNTAEREIDDILKTDQ